MGKDGDDVEKLKNKMALGGVLFGVDYTTQSKWVKTLLGGILFSPKKHKKSKLFRR